MTLDADEFIRRFLLHALPDGFHRIRHYGFLANGQRGDKLALCRQLLDACHASANPAAPEADRERRSQINTTRLPHLPRLRRHHAAHRSRAAFPPLSAILL